MLSKIDGPFVDICRRYNGFYVIAKKEKKKEVRLTRKQMGLSIYYKI